MQKRVTVQKSVTRVQITTKISAVKRRLPEANRCISKTAKDRVKPSEDFQRSPEFFQKSPEHFQRFPKITWILPKFSEDPPITSEDLRQSPEISEDHRIFSKVFQVLEDRGKYPLRTSVVNVWLSIFSSPMGSCNFVSLWKNFLVLIYSKLHLKSCDYLSTQIHQTKVDMSNWDNHFSWNFANS